MTRYYAICRPRSGEPFVFAVTPDESAADDMGRSLSGSLALTRDEALLDPDFRAAVLAFEVSDDRAYAAWRAEEEAGDALIDAAVDAATEGLERGSEEWEKALREAHSAAIEAVHGSWAPRG